MDEFERGQLLLVLQEAIGEMGSEIERAIGEGLMAGLQAVLDTPFADIPKGAPWPKSMTSEHITCSIVAPCGCSTPVQVILSASTGGIPKLSLDAQAAAATCEPIGGMAVEYKEVGSPIPCSEHRPPPTPAPGSVYMSRAALLAAWKVVRVADHFDDRHEGASTILGPIADVVEVNLADLRTLRAALPKEGA